MAERVCTWKDCQKEAAHLQKGRDGAVWADLCQEHHERLKAAIANAMENQDDSAAPRLIVGAWACAGHKLRRGLFGGP